MTHQEHSRRRRPSCLLAVWPLSAACGILVLGATSAMAGHGNEGTEFFERKVRPILAERCYSCHSRSARHLQAELSLDARAGILKGGESGPALVPGKPEESLLVEAVRYEGDTQMPPDGKLPTHEIAVLAEWVRRGAPLPEDGSAAPSTKPSIDFEAGRRFWSFQPLRHAELPPTAARDWARGPIDTLVLAALESRGLAPSPAADRRALVRRVSFDLVGLPPTADEVERFTADTRADAYERVVERLLDSPHYGERWGRYWLDLARYADANETSLENRPRAWLYRDWVVRAFNEDLPYDRFVMLQLAADLIPGTPPADLAALGFFGVGPEYFKELKLSPAMIETIVADEREERIDALGRTFLGLSLACARCHDHKYDPISTEDYYALAGVLASTRLTDRYVIAEPQARVVRAARKQIAELEARLAKLKSAKTPTAEKQKQAAGIKKEIQQIEDRTPHYATALAHGVDDAALSVLPDGADHTKLEYRPGQSLDMRVQIRGNPARPGRVVPRRFLTVLGREGARPFGPGSGRRELAEAIVHDAAPLAARVIVNRVWKLHVGSGLVETVSDFGAQGARPTNPQLLDDLALRFIEHGWSLKWLHREIVLSSTYRQSSDYDSAKFAADPENRWLWRMNRRRLDVEAWRDAMLLTCGSLDERLGGLPARLTDENHRRTIYARISRAEVEPMLRLFDFPDPSSHSPDRPATTTPLQQLFVLNGPLVARQATALVGRMKAGPTTAEEDVRWIYRQLLARSPTAHELRLGVEFLSAGPTRGMPDRVRREPYARAMLGSNEFLFID